jgi:type IV secretory pathway VirJ component
MKKIAIFTIFSALFLILKSSIVSASDSLDVAPFGKVFIYKKADTPRYVIIMISGDAGWRFGVVGFSETFSEMNALVIGVDIRRYFKDLRQRQSDCYTVAADFVNLATIIEKRYNFPDYRPALIMGYSSGATLVYGILAQARAGTFLGGISLGFCPDIELPKMLCQTNGLTERIDKSGKSYFLQPDAKLGNPWIILQGKEDRVCNFSEAEEFVGKTTDAELIALPNVGHGFSKYSDFMPEWKDAYNRLIEKYEKSQQSYNPPDQIKNLPLSITDAKIQKNDASIALIISGDGGWYWFEQAIANHLATLGIPTIGLDSKKYFWKRRTPEETAGDMAKAMNYYGNKWGIDKYIIIGYSLGAEIVPFIINRFPEEIKSKISSSVLLSPATTTDFEIHISNMLGMGNRNNTYNVIDEIIRMHSTSSLIILGEEEKSKVPALLTGTSIKIRTLPGDHHYKLNLPLIIQTMTDNVTF